MRRHDYLPFGEELFAGQGGRTTQQGYVVDGVRQQFTSQERDNETGLDYMHARYFASVQGRFTSADSFAGSIGNPQSLNRYAYVVNNPINLSDPTGHEGRYNAHSASTNFMHNTDGGCTPQHPCQEYPEDWASSGNHPQQGLIQEEVNVDISTPVEMTPINVNPTIQLQSPIVSLFDQYVPTPGTMPNQGGHDTPDAENFIQLNVSVQMLIGLDFSVTRDDYGNWYAAAGPGLGLGFPVSGSLVSGVTLSDLGIPIYSEADVIDTLSGPSITVMAGGGFVGGRSWNNPVILGNTIPLVPRGGGARMVGIGLPQIGISQQEAVKIPFIKF